MKTLIHEQTSSEDGLTITGAVDALHGSMDMVSAMRAICGSDDDPLLAAIDACLDRQETLLRPLLDRLEKQLGESPFGQLVVQGTAT